MTASYTRRPSILSRFLGPSRPRDLLDPRDLSPHVLRDLGLLDGHAPQGSIR